MAQDIRELFKNDNLSQEKMPKHHEKRFLEKLDKALPEKKSGSYWSWMQIAASVVVILGLSFGGYTFFKHDPKPVPNTIANTNTTNISNNNSGLGSVSPDLKKVENYYLASISLELSKIKPTPETKELYDDYLEQIATLDKEYKRLSQELETSGLSELTVNALIDNLKWRLNLLYRLREQVKILNTDSELNQNHKSI
ncbi:hypothetical protein [Gaetbulibacter aestuarii]|uniref:Anti-sigma factor n=1 Tax=Gaetbulibacter aestuarii TaxID=1502358 RepID=A0ABW7N2F8_9FLAO